MSSSSEPFFLFDSTSVEEIAEVTSSGLDVYFPEGIGWPEVLDCRIPPYTEKSIEENCHFADHVRKPYILVTADQRRDETRPSDV